MQGTLNKTGPSESFTFRGECYLQLKGTGTVMIKRDLGAGFEIMTDEIGNLMAFSADGGIAFNGVIKSNKGFPYCLTTDGEFEYVIKTEER